MSENQRRLVGNIRPPMFGQKYSAKRQGPMLKSYASVGCPGSGGPKSPRTIDSVRDSARGCGSSVWLSTRAASSMLRGRLNAARSLYLVASDDGNTCTAASEKPAIAAAPIRPIESASDRILDGWAEGCAAVASDFEKQRT